MTTPTEVDFRGLVFLESVYPEWTGSSDGGMVVWEPLDKGCSPIPERYNPKEEGSLEAAKSKIKRTVLYCRPKDETKADE